MLLKYIFVNCQFLLNPSFEGTKGPGQSPQYWTPCLLGSTPDTQPGSWGVSNQPTNGETYIGMVCRGSYSDTCEAIQQKLQKPLLKNTCYNLMFDLAYSNKMELGHNNPTKLRIWGGNNSCEMNELIWESPTVTSDWKTYNLSIFSEKASFEYLIFEANYITSNKYDGNLILDNVRLKEPNQIPDKILDTTLTYNTEFVLKALNGDIYNWQPTTNLSCFDCQFPVLKAKIQTKYIVTITNKINNCVFIHEFNIGIGVKTNDSAKPIEINIPKIITPKQDNIKSINVPNVITPNDDKINDYFYIEGLDKSYSIHIYNRLGTLIYFSDSYENNWDGKSNDKVVLPDGMYYYYLNSDKLDFQFKGWVQVIR